MSKQYNLLSLVKASSFLLQLKIFVTAKTGGSSVTAKLILQLQNHQMTLHLFCKSITDNKAHICCWKSVPTTTNIQFIVTKFATATLKLWQQPSMTTCGTLASYSWEAWLSSSCTKEKNIYKHWPDNSPHGLKWMFLFCLFKLFSYLPQWSLLLGTHLMHMKGV